ncbi:hypothetical protein [Sphingomonas glacialis]|uniref:Uncharacterized protein n=1 Tax=Sphingomonas glacialis TaxID=658225 RepID=A0A502FVP6_9SPHN|nr:hypothetical protein [Sphingomonas glacialis]TPG53023.1 hypothetical protein EAH76_14395 [Sphingomonas glacialis]
MRTTTRDAIDHSLGEADYWFVPKMFGIGVKPATWQGWAITIGFAAVLIADIRLVHERIAQVGIGIALVVMFTAIAVRKTRGGVRWRWGTRD